MVGHLLDAAVEAVGAGVGGVLGQSQLAVVSVEGLVLPCEGGVFFFELKQFLLGEAVLLRGLFVPGQQVFVLAEGDAGGETQGGDGADEE